MTSIEIIKFKCFKDFEAKDFKRVNLITGKNNVGKTAFMEACYINTFSETSPELIDSIIGIKFMRENINLLYKPRKKTQEFIEFLDFIKELNIKSNIREQCFKIKEENAIKEYSITIDKKQTIIKANDITIPTSITKNSDFIDNFGFSNKEINRKFISIQRQDKEDEINAIIKNFDPRIHSFKVFGDNPQCKVNDNGQSTYRDIVELGDGLKHYISIIFSLYASENGYLFIDEIGNGIHYSQIDKLWELIFTISEKTNCQVFANTHSKEMIESFARTANKLNCHDISLTTLVLNKKSEIKALTLNHEMLQDSFIEQQHEVR
jgi:AAA15 family ATPase/GTPase